MPRKQQLYPMLKTLLIQRIFSIPRGTLLIVLQDFLLDLQSMFDRLVDLTEPICQRIDPNLASITIFDTSEIEAWVIENNPKYANRIIKQLKAFAKANNFDKNYDPYKAVRMIQHLQ